MMPVNSPSQPPASDIGRFELEAVERRSAVNGANPHYVGVFTNHYEGHNPGEVIEQKLELTEAQIRRELDQRKGENHPWSERNREGLQFALYNVAEANASLPHESVDPIANLIRSDHQERALAEQFKQAATGSHADPTPSQSPASPRMSNEIAMSPSTFM